MSRPLLLVVALGCLALGALFAPPPPAAAVRPLTALGRSLGGVRVLAVDALFLRAESLRRQGRTEELAALYQAIVDLDPDNVPALDLLAGELADNLLPTAPTPAGRAAWWRAALDLVERGLALHPGSVRLTFRAADLLLGTPERHPEVCADLDGRPGGRSAREARGLALLVVTARATGHLPRLGRLHLLRLSRWAPLLSVRALARGDSVADAALRLAAAEELAVMHADALLLMQEEVARPAGSLGSADAAAEPASAPVASVLSAAIHAVRVTLLLREGEPSTRALEALALYRALVGSTQLESELAAYLARR